MYILFVAPSYFPRVGGVEYVVKSVAERLATRGHEVVVLAGEPNVEKPREEEINGVRVMRWPTWTPGGAYHIPKRRAELEKTVEEYARRADVVHVHSAHSVFSVWAGLRVRGARLVFTLHYHGAGHTTLRSALWTLWRRQVAELVRRADVVHSVSNYEARLVEAHFGVKPVVIEHGVEERAAEMQWRPEDYVLYSGRIERYKNIEKVAQVVEALGGLRLVIVGEGPHAARLEKTLRRMRLRWERLPFQPYEKYLEILSRARLYASLSLREAFSITANEASAMGVPVLAAKPWGEHFAHRPRTLVVDPAEEPQDIARKVAEFLEDAPKQPKPRVHTWNEVVDHYIKMYSSNH